MNTTAVYCAVVAAVVAMARSAIADAAPDSCVQCHSALETTDEGAARLMAHDVHASVGLSCADCHGGDPRSPDMLDAMSAEKGYIGVPGRNEIPQFCSRCHSNPEYMKRYNPNLATDQFQKYQSSQHGKLNAGGDQRVAVCTSCHDAHGVRRVNDPLSPVFKRNAPLTCAKCHADSRYMQDYDIPTNQFEEYKRGVHGIALLEQGNLGAPACHSCHGSHEASRPGQIWVGNVCAQCHSLNRDLFAASPHKQAHDAMGVTECAVCHENHDIKKTSDEMLGTGAHAVCVQCHETDSKGYASAQDMKGHIDDLKGRIARAKREMEQAEHEGMDMSDSRIRLSAVQSLLTKSRTYVHSFSHEKIREITGEGDTLADGIVAQALAAHEEIRYRRKGLWLSIVFLALLAAGLVLRIRRIERNK